MRKIALRRVVHVCSSLVAIAGVAWAADVLTQIGVPARAAQEAVVSWAANGYFDMSLGFKALKAAPPAARAQLVTGIIGWAKSYSTSPEFKIAYAKVRDTRKPEEPKFVGTPEEEYTKQRAQQKAEAEKSQAEMKGSLAQMTPEVRKAVEEGMKAAAEMQKNMDTPEMRKMMIDGIAMSRTSKRQEYERDTLKWQQDFPENPRAAVIKRLQKFLDETKDVDFDAALTTRNGQKVFVKEAYENKSGDWKLAFRAGRETLAAARTAVQAWLTELQKTT